MQNIEVREEAQIFSTNKDCQDITVCTIVTEHNLLQPNKKAKVADTHNDLKDISQKVSPIQLGSFWRENTKHYSRYSSFNYLLKRFF